MISIIGIDTKFAECSSSSRSMHLCNYRFPISIPFYARSCSHSSYVAVLAPCLFVFCGGIFGVGSKCPTLSFSWLDSPSRSLLQHHRHCQRPPLRLAKTSSQSCLSPHRHPEQQIKDISSPLQTLIPSYLLLHSHSRHTNIAPRPLQIRLRLCIFPRL